MPYLALNRQLVLAEETHVDYEERNDHTSNCDADV